MKHHMALVTSPRWYATAKQPREKWPLEPELRWKRMDQLPGSAADEGWIAGWLVLVGWFAGWMAGWLVLVDGWMVGCFEGWMVEQLVDAGWIDRWMIGVCWMVGSINLPMYTSHNWSLIWWIKNELPDFGSLIFELFQSTSPIA